MKAFAEINKQQDIKNVLALFLIMGYYYKNTNKLYVKVRCNLCGEESIKRKERVILCKVL